MSGTDTTSCPNCKGRGYEGMGDREDDFPCRTCKGAKSVPLYVLPCGLCDGTGTRMLAQDEIGPRICMECRNGFVTIRLTGAMRCAARESLHDDLSEGCGQATADAALVAALLEGGVIDV